MCEGMGAHVIRANTRDAFIAALEEARTIKNRPVCIVTEVDRRQRVGGHESWWDVAVAQVSENPDVQQARQDYEEAKKKQRHYL
jgi:3D-(3,5/4)-trihydroxycyclohexane-1,2-dione acylhydrolase (decyclizing)